MLHHNVAEGTGGSKQEIEGERVSFDQEPTAVISDSYGNHIKHSHDSQNLITTLDLIYQHCCNRGQLEPQTSEHTFKTQQYSSLFLLLNIHS